MTVTVGVTFSRLTTSVGSSTGVGDASGAFELCEPGRRKPCFIFFSVGFGVGRGWNAFETDWPTLLKKSPTGSASAHGPVKKNSAASDNEARRERMRRLIELSAFNVKQDFPRTLGAKRRKFSLHKRASVKLD